MNLVIASYGGGINSTAMLIEMVKRGERVDLILFADTGGEKPHTYKYLNLFQKWLIGHNYGPIIVVKKAGNGETLEQNCLRKKMLPSLAYGFKSCSQKYKIQPQDKYVNNWPPAKDEWKAGRKIVKLIGFDADESHRTNKDYISDKYEYRYPLVDWDMGRDECIETIKKAGLCLPGKSACFFCPASKASEIRQLAQNYPELIKRALEMEENAELSSVKGLGRRFAWRDLISQGELFAEAFNSTPEMICGCYDG